MPSAIRSPGKTIISCEGERDALGEVEDWVGGVPASFSFSLLRCHGQTICIVVYYTGRIYKFETNTSYIYRSVYISRNAIDFNRGAYIFPTCVDLVYFLVI